MTDDERKKLEKFETHFHLLMEKYVELKKEKASLTALLEKKDAQITALTQEKEDAIRQYQNLKIAKMLTISDQDIDQSKKRLAKLVRDVDKCIALLNT